MQSFLSIFTQLVSLFTSFHFASQGEPTIEIKFVVAPEGFIHLQPGFVFSQKPPPRGEGCVGGPGLDPWNFFWEMP